MGKDGRAEENGGGRDWACYGIILPSCTIMAEDPPLHSFAISLSGPSGAVRLAGPFHSFLFLSSSSRMRVRGSQGNAAEGWGGVHDRVYTSSIFITVRVHSTEPKREGRKTRLASAQNTVRVMLNPLKDKTKSMPRSASTARATKRQTESS